ncbi:MAG TPA: hypothetical protein PLL75_00200 [Candidatus Omnitrophota bacterium]|nr:hypothetical protein [Candidatus Omnitrophota bacterium]HPS36138.1 hypothetical protein [Candidatus Omnitrophota bacterium]
MMRAFVRFREFRLTRKNLARKFEKLERKFKKYEDEIHMIFDAIRQLMKPPESLCRTIGFQT